MQPRMTDGKGSRHWKNDLCERTRKEGYDFDPTMLYENHDRFWNRRPDGIVINKNHQTLYILEFGPGLDV